jgi:hypothetical protein
MKDKNEMLLFGFWLIMIIIRAKKYFTSLARRLSKPVFLVSTSHNTQKLSEFTRSKAVDKLKIEKKDDLSKGQP